MDLEHSVGDVPGRLQPIGESPRPLVDVDRRIAGAHDHATETARPGPSRIAEDRLDPPGDPIGARPLDREDAVKARPRPGSPRRRGVDLPQVDEADAQARCEFPKRDARAFGPPRRRGQSRPFHRGMEQDEAEDAGIGQ